MISLEVDVQQQIMRVLDEGKEKKCYQIATAKNGVGEVYGSEQTPRGWHIIRAKIGKDCPLNTVFVKRRPTGEVYSETFKETFPKRDWILTRIFWLSGLEVGKNRLGNVDTMRRYVYIHGTPDDVRLGAPSSKGCIRMDNHSIIELFDMIPVGTKLLIKD